MPEAIKPAMKIQILANGIQGYPEDQSPLGTFMNVDGDATAAIMAIRKGFSMMQYAEKSQRIRLGALKEALCESEDVELRKIDTSLNTADCLQSHWIEHHSSFTDWDVE